MKLTFTIAILLIVFKGYTQVEISGRMTDTKGKPLYGASISLKDSYDGTTTDSLGNFSFNTEETGKQLLQATLEGYASFEQIISIAGKPIELKISVKELITELNAVVITAGSFEASDKKKGTVLTPLDIVTTASAEGDVTGALKSLPGTQQVGETGGLFVRGGTATESKIYIDGNLVNNFFYSSLPGISSRGRFNPFLFKGTVFSAGGYSALYGQALSSALILESTDLPERTEGSLNISVIGIGAGIQKLAKDKKSSWGLTYNFSHLGPAFALIKQRQDYYQNPVFHEADGNFRIKTKRGGMLKYYSYWSTGKVGYRSEDIDSANLKNAFNLDNVNTYQNLNLRENLGKGWKLSTGLSYSTNIDEMENELQDANETRQVFMNPAGYAFKNFSIVKKSHYAQARAYTEKKLKGLNAVRFGADYFYSQEKNAYTDYNGAKSDFVITDQLSAAFAETDLYLSKDLAAKIGGRAEHSKLVDEWNIAPRLSLAYKLKNNGQASLAYGVFYQNPESTLEPALPGAGYAKAAHYIFQYQKIKNDRSFRAEIFYKAYQNLFTTTNDSYGRTVAADNDGTGYAKGIEFFWRDKKSVKNLDYWISYSYLDTKRKYLNFPEAIRPNFSAMHTASLVVKKFVLPWKTGFNAAYNFATGRPFYDIRFDGLQDKYVIADKGTTIPYHSLSFSLNYLPKLGKTDSKIFPIIVMSVSNVLGQQQVYNYTYGSITGNRRPILPTSRRFVFVGCFISFGTDRTDDAINNNL